MSHLISDDETVGHAIVHVISDDESWGTWAPADDAAPGKAQEDEPHTSSWATHNDKSWNQTEEDKSWAWEDKSWAWEDKSWAREDKHRHGLAIRRRTMTVMRPGTTGKAKSFQAGTTHGNGLATTTSASSSHPGLLLLRRSGKRLRRTHARRLANAV